MNTKIFLLLPFSLLLLQGCQKPSSEIKLQELDGKVFVVDEEAKNVYQVHRDNLILLKKGLRDEHSAPDSNIIETELGITNGLQLDAKFKVESGKIRYILILGDKKYAEAHSAAIIQDELSKLEKFDSEGLQIIRAIADASSSTDRFDRISLEFRDADGFLIHEHDIVLSKSGFTRVSGPSGKLRALLLEGEISHSDIEPHTIDSISLSFNGFDLAP